MMDKDPTAELMAAMARWADLAVHRASPAGKIEAMAALAGAESDLMLTVQFKRGVATLFACTRGADPIEVAQAQLPPLRPHGQTLTAGPETLQ